MTACKVVILAGGEGVRFQPLTLTRPKAMIPLGTKPVIEHLTSQIVKCRFRNLIITLNYQKEQLMHFIGDGSKLGVQVEYAIEPEGNFLGTAGGVKLVSNLLKDTFMILQGDAYTTMNFNKILNFHKQSGADATIVLKEVADPWHYGNVKCNANGEITDFQEKPIKGKETGNLVSTGIYCLEPDVLDIVKPGECDFGRDVFPHLLRENRSIRGYVADELWIDTGSLAGFIAGTRHVLGLNGEDEDKKHPPLAPIGNNVLLGEKVKVTGPSLIEDNVSIGKGSQIGPYAVLKRDATLGEEVIIENASIFEGAKVGSYDKIRGSIIGEQANLAERVVVDGSIIGPGSTLEQSVEVKSGSRIWPGIRVAAAVRLIHRTIRLPTDNPFYFNSDVGKFTGLTATTIGDLADELERVEVRSIEFHLEKGDFERWIRNIFQVDTLAERISDLRGHGLQGEVLRKEFISIVRTWLRYSTESN